MTAPLPPTSGRWTAIRKLDVLNAIHDGELSEAEAARLYSLSDDELREWTARAERFGSRGLCTTKTQELRP